MFDLMHIQTSLSVSIYHASIWNYPRSTCHQLSKVHLIHGFGKRHLSMLKWMNPKDI